MTAHASGCDLLVVSPHTDDAEIALGGTIALLADRGRDVRLLDLTRGELGSNGTPDERWAEAAEASRILGVTGRIQLELPDGFIDAGDREQVEAVASLIRALRPRWVCSSPMPNRHPDHRAIPGLVEKAAFMARLAAWTPPVPAMRTWGSDVPDPADRWACEAVLHVSGTGETPDLLFDVGAVWERKTAALAAYVSQFDDGGGRRSTMINDPAFLEHIERRAREWGFRAGATHAEALRTAAAPVLTDLPAERWS